MQQAMEKPQSSLYRPSQLLRPDAAHGLTPGDMSTAGSSTSPRLPHQPILLHPLPPASALQKEGLAQSELELHRQQTQLAREKALAEALQDQAWEIERTAARDEMGTWSRHAGTSKGKKKETRGFERPPQAWELYKAIDGHDIEYIMRIRDHAFGLLLQKNGGEFPVIYAARQGEKHRDVVILLVGAMSRYVNYLDEEDYGKKETKDILKMLRSNLKLAIDNALLPSASSPNLLSSYLQVLIMSEGDVWLHRTINDITLILRNPSQSVKPVAEAERIVRSFCTKELRGVPGGVSDVEEYISNATLDLIIMSTWNLAAGQVDLDRLPTHTFARDIRTWTVLKETMDEHQVPLRKLTKRVERMLQTILDYGGDSKKSVRGRLRDVQKFLDGEDV